MAKETVVAQVGQPTSENELAIRQEVSGVTIQVEGMVIDSEDSFEEAAKIGLAIKAQAKKVAEFFAPMKKRASDAHKEICNREKMMLSPLQEAEKALKNKMGAYRLEEDRRRQLAEEEARRAAEEEQRRKEAEAIALESEGRNSEAYAALMEAEVAENAAKGGIYAPAPKKTAGVTVTKDWEITGIDESQVPVSIMGAVIRPVDQAAIMRLIRATKGGITIPGVEYTEKTRMSFRGNKA